MNEITGMKVVLGPLRCKRNQRVMNREQSTSISGNHHPENTRGEGSERTAHSLIIHQLAAGAPCDHWPVSILAAAITAWVRLSTPSFCRMAETCAFTVASDTPS